jgi:spore coat polysaccharide biosynthesis protein SpsF
MEVESVGIIVTARVKSSRIPEKVLQTINGKRAIDILLSNLKRQDRFPVVMAIPKNHDDDILEDIATNRGVECYRGEDDSPLHRIVAAAEKFGFEYIVRVTADDILIDSQILINQVRFALNGGLEYCFITKMLQGAAAEVIKLSALKDVVKRVGNQPVEFISYYLKNQYKTKEYFPPEAYRFSYRLVLDYPEDLMLMRLVFACLPEPINTLDIIHFLRQHPYFLQINHLPEVTVYTCNHNTGRFIVEAMDSVFRQEFKDFEYILIDDKSSDDSMNIITEYWTNLPTDKQKKMKVYRNEKNIDLASCSNMALALGRGRYIIRLDSDDIFLPGILSQMVEQLQLDNSQAVLSGFTRIAEDGKDIAVIDRNEWHPACALLSRWAVNEIKYRDGVKYAEGDEFYNQFKKKYRVSFIKDSLWKYRQREGQKTAQPDHPNNTVK